MDAFISMIVTVIQLALAGFLAWGAWLAFRTTHPAAKPALRAQADDFERVASLVLLALLSTTLLPLA